MNTSSSDHAKDQVVDELFSVTPVSSSLEGVSLVRETSSGSSELEGPQEVVCFLEVRADAPDLVDQILDTDDSVFAQNLLNHGVAGQRNSLLVDLTITSLQN